MNEINGIPQNLLDEMQIPGKENKSVATNFGKDAFMTLMLAQLKNQNPMEPMTNGEFLTQIAQFTAANGINDLQESFATFAGTMQSQQALQAANMVGRQVVVATDILNWDGSNIANARIELPNASQNITVNVTTPQGNSIRRIDLGSHAAGTIPFSWDGLDNSGNPVRPGTFIVTATAESQGQSLALRTMVAAAVESVVLGRNGGETVLNLQNLGPVPVSQVQEIM